MGLELALIEDFGGNFLFFFLIKSFKTFVQVLVIAQWKVVPFDFPSWFAKYNGSSKDEAELLGEPG